MQIAGYAIGIVIVVAMIFVLGILEGWAVSTLWNWFVATTFGLPRLFIPLAIGLAMTATVFQVPPCKARKEESIDRSIQLICQPFFCVLFGWIIKEFFL